MYLTHYNLRAKPFSISPDPKFLWLGEKHKEALAVLKYAILENKGFLLLTGDIGSGKTAIINTLIELIDVTALVAAIPDPGMSSLDFFNFLSEEFGMNRQFKSKGEFLIHFKQLLLDAYSDRKKVLLIVDEAQRLDHELLEQIRLLSNIEMENRKLINIFFVGQSEFTDILLDDRNKAVRQRLSVGYHLDPLTEDETAKYIHHRLKVAGAAAEIFTAGAIGQICAFSKGNPRLINILCDHALLSGYSAGVTVIDKNIVKECADELQIAGDSVDFPINPKLPDISVAETGGAGRSQTQKIALSLVVMLVFSIAGYFMYDAQMNESTPWEMEDIAAKKDLRISEEDKKALIAKISEADRTPQKQASAETDNTETRVETKGRSSAHQSDVEKDGESPAKGFDALKNYVSNFKFLIQDPGQTVVVHFEHNSNEIPNQAFQSLDRVVRFTRTNPESEIIIEGYTDAYGDYAYNKKLSKFRADIIRNYFAAQGIPLSRIKAYGLGSENPIAGNDTFEGRKQNRRVEIKINMK